MIYLLHWILYVYMYCFFLLNKYKRNINRNEIFFKGFKWVALIVIYPSTLNVIHIWQCFWNYFLRSQNFNICELRVFINFIFINIISNNILPRYS